MGKLIDGKWEKRSIITSDEKGSYARLPRTFENKISSDDAAYTPDSERYHLYVSYACPWATRALIYRKLKSLEDHISVDVVHPDLLEEGWAFDDSYPGATKESLYGFKFLRELYQKSDPNVTTSVTVPVLWDKQTETIVNNESSQVIRIFNSAFNELTGNNENYYPNHLQEEINKLNDWIYSSVNNGVYKCGFAKTQESYDEAVTALFEALDELDQRLAKSKYLIEDILTEADLRLIPTLLRFDVAYVTHFKCNIKRIIDYKHLSRYVNDLMTIPAIKDSTKFDHIKRHYYFSHKEINPYRIVPAGPELII
ncbi:MAG: glutathione S-transferase family protein [Gammaproteobacteria bacterium]|jgi:putative glutathione S-transferase